MVRVNQSVYKEMVQLGLLKQYKVLEQQKDKYGNERTKTVICKNFRVVNKHKNSRVKTYFVQSDVYEDYIKTIG